MKIPDKYDTVFALQFEDPVLAGVEVKVRMSYGLLDSTGASFDIDFDAIKQGQAKPEDLAKLRALVDDFAGALVSWNLDGDDGQPLPTDRDTVRSLDHLLVVALVAAFMTVLQEMADRAQETVRQVAEADVVDESTLPVQVAG